LIPEFFFFSISALDFSLFFPLRKKKKN